MREKCFPDVYEKDAEMARKDWPQNGPFIFSHLKWAISGIVGEISEWANLKLNKGKIGHFGVFSTMIDHLVITKSKIALFKTESTNGRFWARRK